LDETLKQWLLDDRDEIATRVLDQFPGRRLNDRHLLIALH